jgi:hypothetical protein
MLYAIYNTEGMLIGRSWGNSPQDALERATLHPAAYFALPVVGELDPDELVTMEN